MKNMQEQDISTSIPFEWKFYALQLCCETFVFFLNVSKVLVV